MYVVLLGALLTSTMGGPVHQPSLAVDHPSRYEASVTGGLLPAIEKAVRQFERAPVNVDRVHARQASDNMQIEKSWISRHPALFGAAIGAGGGAVAGATLGHDCGTDEDWCSRGSVTLMGAGIGAGVGAIVGLLVGAAAQ